MDHKDQFSKWMSVIEEGLRIEELGGMPLNLPSADVHRHGECNCGDWDCETCFPNEHGEPEGILVIGGQESCPACGQEIQQNHGCDFGEPQDDEVDLVLADQFSDDGSDPWTDDEKGEMSPLTYGDDNLTRKITYETHELEDGHDSKHPLLAQFSPIQLTEFKLIVQGRGQLERHPELAEKIVKYYQESGEMPEQMGNIYSWVKNKLDEDFGGALEENIMKLNEFDMNDNDFGSGDYDMEPDQGGMEATPNTQMMSDPDEDVSELIGKIQYMQDMGLSASPRHFAPEMLMNMDPEMVKRIYQKVKGGVQEHGMQPQAQELAQDHEELAADNMYESDEFEFGSEDNESDVEAEGECPEVKELASKLGSGEITLDEFQAQVDALDSEDSGDAESELSFGIGEPEIEECGVESMSPIEKKIALAKAALDRKNEGLEEEDDETGCEPTDHGLGSLGNKIVDAKMKAFGKENSTFSPPSDVMDDADPEIMEWVKRFAARDSIMKENLAQQNTKPQTTQTVEKKTTEKKTTNESADSETLEWYERLKKVAR